QTDLGKKAESFMLAGQLVPDAVVIGIVDERLLAPDCHKGYVLDGFPRTEAQAEALSLTLENRGTKIHCVINIEVPDVLLVARLSGRRVCGTCGASYHIEYSPSKTQGICDQCQNELIQRKDDNEETVQERLRVYHSQTKPLIAYYAKQNTLRPIDGTGEIGFVKERIAKVLG
ncbi:MAG TPA: nucleoside monophosphate kinase, partial [bacterium]|nr:nucleoside monophosphate kinase [bacterium]